MSKPERMDEFFKSRADGYDEHMRQNVEAFEKIYQVVAEPVDEKKDTLCILDLGCGTGLELEAIFQKAPNAFVTGIDLSEEMLSLLRKKHSSRREQLSLIQGSYLEFQFPDFTYDYALSVMTLHHLNKAEKRKIYKKIYTTLKENGSYIEADYVVSSQEEAKRLENYKQLKKKYSIEDMYNYHVDIPFSKQNQINLFKQAGFECVETVYEVENACVFHCKKKQFRLGG